MLKWVFERCAGTAPALSTPIGNLPTPDSLDTQGLDIAPADVAELLRVDTAGWLAEVPLIREHFAKFAPKLPAALSREVDALEKRLQAAR